MSTRKLNGSLVISTLSKLCTWKVPSHYICFKPPALLYKSFSSLLSWQASSREQCTHERSGARSVSHHAAQTGVGKNKSNSFHCSFARSFSQGNLILNIVVWTISAVGVEIKNNKKNTHHGNSWGDYQVMCLLFSLGGWNSKLFVFLSWVLWKWNWAALKTQDSSYCFVYALYLGYFRTTVKYKYTHFILVPKHFVLDSQEPLNDIRLWQAVLRRPIVNVHSHNMRLLVKKQTS